MRKSLTKGERIRDASTIKQLYRGRATRRRGGLRLFYALNGRAWSRIVVCPTRGFRTAVARNRERRLVREALRIVRPTLAPGYDLLVQVGQSKL